MPKPIRTVSANKRKKSQPLWKGPIEDGITFSLLSKFVVCPERFRLKVVEGVVEDEGFNHAIEFGSLWHEAEEAHSGKKPWKPAIGRYRDKLRANYPSDESEIRKWYNVAVNTFPLYVDHWRTHEIERGRKPIFEEVSFRVPYKLPSGRIIVLRGKWDCVYRIKASVYLQENKTKGKIDEEGLQATIDQNLQTMLYQIALRTIADKKGPEPLNEEMEQVTKRLRGELQSSKIKGVLYNVVRRPLSDQHAIRQKKTETERQFFKRMVDSISDNPEHYFKRWKVTLTNNDLERFKTRILHPLLERLLDWWEWITADLSDPWRVPTIDELPADVPYDAVRPPAKGVPGGGIHYQSPWGVYNSLAGGFRGDYFDFLTTGRRGGLTKIDTLFPEL